MNRKLIVAGLLIVGVFWTATAGLLSLYQSSKSIGLAENVYKEKVRAMGQVLSSSIRSDLLTGNIRQAVRTLEGFRGTNFLVGYQIESQALQQPVVGIDQNIQETSLQEIVPIRYSLENNAPHWGVVHLYFSSDEISALRTDLRKQFVAPLLGSALGVATLAIFLGLFFYWHNRFLFYLLDRQLINRQPLKISNRTARIFEPLVMRIQRVRKKLSELEIEKLNQAQALATYDAARQIAHDLKGPLTFLRFYSANNTHVSLEDSRNLGLLADRLERMSAQLLKQNLTIEIRKIKPKNLFDKCEEFVSYKRSECRERKIVWTSEEPIQLPAQYYLNVDLSFFERVLDNLITNAIEATELNHLIRVTATIKSDFELIVEDDGPGLPTQVKSALRVGSSPMTTKQSGHGLGLSFCQEVIKSLNGVLESSESSELGGALIKIRLPLVTE